MNLVLILVRALVAAACVAVVVIARTTVGWPNLLTMLGALLVLLAVLAAYNRRHR
ncbi:DUF6903 family protein [Winogradskya humida]|uniref:MYXO-CTERM domain-containing protein n=1 Tax=Winogradskya humida TaxID=113566 RepID=A0ABQ3ZP97_9ACTN|nr:hypothetical protein [Actinoplanes humidus]GIE20406.1 hypothetical protein Ahu01nite_035080 [Actinoplanes humidus]